MSSFILIQGVLDLVTVQDFTISFYLKEKKLLKEEYGSFYSFNYDFIF